MRKPTKYKVSIICNLEILYKSIYKIYWVIEGGGVFLSVYPPCPSYELPWHTVELYWYENSIKIIWNLFSMQLCHHTSSKAEIKMMEDKWTEWFVEYILSWHRNLNKIVQSYKERTFFAHKFTIIGKPTYHTNEIDYML